MQLLSSEKVIYEFKISLGKHPIGHKQFEGDSKTPEGNYTIDWRNENSNFYRSLHISYPNDRDIAYAENLGRSAGGLIMIHGLPNKYGWLGKLHLLKDWTDGCIAVTNKEMDIIWEVIQDGTAIHIAE